MTGVANDWTPPAPRPLTAVEEAMKLVDWATARLQERGRLKPSERSSKAQEYETAAERCWASRDVEGAGRYRAAARILRAELP